MEEIPTLEHTEDIELVVHNRQTTPDTTPAEVPNNSGDEEEESIFHDALTDFNASTDEQLTATVQSRPGAAAEDGTSKSLKKLWTSVSEKANSIIGIGVFILTIIGVVYTVWTAKKDYYEYCYERSKMPGGLSPECDSVLRDGISPPFHWHTVKSLPGIAASTLRQGQNMTLSTLDSRLSNKRPAIVFLSGALCSLLLAGICFCIAKYGRPVRKVLIRTVRQLEAWVATVVARQAHHLKDRQQRWRTRQTKTNWITVVKSGVASSDLHRPRRGFTRRDTDVDSEASQPLLSEGLSEQAQMRCNAEILAAYISHLREFYLPHRPAIFIGHLPYASDHEKSIISCSRVDLRQSLHNLQPRSTSSAAVICQKDISSASSNYWMLQLPSESSLSEKLLTMNLGSGPRSVSEADHFCDVRHSSINAACHINHFFSITILGDTSSNEIVILVHSHSKLRYRAFLAELQDSAERPLPQIWFKITPIWGGSERDGDPPNANLSRSYLPDLELSDCLKGSAPFFAFRCIGENPTEMSPQDELFLPLPDVQELHMHWDQGSCELSQVFSGDEVILTCSGHDKWRLNLSSEDGATSVYNQDAILDQPLNTTLDAIRRVNDWLLHNLRCSTIELNNFAKNLPEPLSTFLLEDPDLDSNLTNFWTQYILNCGFLDIGTSYDKRRYSGSEYSLYQPSASSSCQLNTLTRNAPRTVSTSDHESGDQKPAHIVSTTAPPIRKPISSLSARFRTKSASDILDRTTFDDIYFARPCSPELWIMESSISGSYLSGSHLLQLLEEEEFERCLAVVNELLANLTDHEKAHDELMRETAARGELYLGLDIAALKALKRGDEELISQLYRAAADLELAEVTLRNRKMALARSDVCTESPEDTSIQDEDLLGIYSQGEDLLRIDIQIFHFMMADRIDVFSQYEDRAALPTANILYSADECRPVFSFPCDDYDQGPAIKATFINKWLLDCLRHSQENASQFGRVIQDFGLNLSDVNLEAVLQAHWHEDGTEHWHEDGTELECSLTPDSAAGPSLVTSPASANDFINVGTWSDPGVNVQDSIDRKKGFFAFRLSVS